MLVVHIIPSLAFAGAEIVLLNLVKTRPVNEECIVITLLPSDSKVISEFSAAKTKVIEINFIRLGYIKGLILLIKKIKTLKPEIIHTWLASANIIGGILRLLGLGDAHIWSFHASKTPEKISSKLSERVCILLSFILPKAIVYPSDISRSFYENNCISKSKSVVIHNGIDLQRFRPQPDERNKYRTLLINDRNLFLIGIIARWHSDKDYITLLKAISILKDNGSMCHLVCVGPEIDNDNQQLSSIINCLKLKSHVTLLGPRDDIPEIMNALDLLVCSSVTEAFGVSVVEAMACGTPALVTDCGFPPYLVQDSKFVVPIGDPLAMASSISMIISSGVSNDLKVRCINRSSVFSNIEMTRKYYSLYAAL